MIEPFKTRDMRIAKQLTKNNTLLSDKQEILLSRIIFFVALAFFFQFANLFKNGVELNFGFFWFLVLCIYGSVAYQIYKFEPDKNSKLFILLEILCLVFFWGLFRIMLLNQTLPGADDAFAVLISTNRIQDQPNILTQGLAFDRWPLLQLLSIAISEIGNIGLFAVALSSPIFYQLLAIVFIYLLGKELYSERSALLACLVFSSFYQVWLINSRFRPEILAYIFFFACIWAFVKRSKTSSKSVLWSSLSIFFVFCIVMTHYTTNIMFIFLLVVTILVFVWVQFLKQAVEKLLKYAPLFTLFAIIIWLGYWVYIGEPLFVMLINSIVEAFEPIARVELEYALAPATPIPLKQVIIGRIAAFYVFLFMGLMAYEVFKQRKCENWQIDFWLASWAAFTFFFWVFLVGIPHVFYAGRAYLFTPSRIYLFLYPFILILIAHIVLKLRARKKILLTGLLIGFALFNIFQRAFVPLNPLSSAVHPPSAGDGTQEIAVTSWAAPKHGSILAPIYFTPKIKYMEREVSVSGAFHYFEDDMAGLKLRFDNLYLNPTAPIFRIGGFGPGVDSPLQDVLLTEQMLYNISNTSWLQKVYSNGEWRIYAITP
ncbi:hypothetical protein LR013_02830 [candidate division NPL-UPA2 bacterium]|nr:hypothetical protein [candidate division NPL-UPA2 bacterium]